MVKRVVLPLEGYSFATNMAVGSSGTTKRGSVDQIADGRVTGWFLDFLAPAVPARLLLTLNGKSVAEFGCGLPREDIADVTGIDSKAGFSFNLNRISPSHAVAFLDEFERNLRDHLDDPADIRVTIKNTSLELDHYQDGEFSVSNLHLLAILRAVAASAVTELSTLKQKLVADYTGREVLTEPADEDSDIRCIAFYLPQFHPIPENDEWWGKGFTEWTNVTRAEPLFDGHEQPRLPSDLGFYDLRLAAIQEQQAKLAAEYGIHGFCYHYYWFSGRKVLQTPIQQMVESGSPNFPFCICWANESWSRRWDGSDKEVLIHQEHDLEIDTGLIDELIPLFKDPRYIRVKGQPLFVIYRVGLLPDPIVLFNRWREACVAAGLPPLHVCMAETFGLADPASWGCDSAVEFPPHKVVAGEIQREIPDLKREFSGNIYDYREVVQNELISNQPDYVRYRSVMMGWDNTPRRGAAGTVFHHASPSYYETWLQGVVDYTRVARKGSERLVFVNAWNEWGEGTYLEPDRRRGHDYLIATRRVLSDAVEWPNLLKSARLRGSLEGVALTNFLDLVEQKLVSSDRSIAFMSTRILSQGLLWGQTLATDIKPPTLSSLPSLDGGRIWIDRLNTHESPRHCGHDRAHTLSISGWALFDGVDINADSPIYLAFHELGGFDHLFRADLQS